MAFKITYSVLQADMSELHKEMDGAFAKIRSNLGQKFPSYVLGKNYTGEKLIENKNPTNFTETLAYFHQVKLSDLDAIIEYSKKAQKSWAATPWKTRVSILKKAADLISERRLESAAIMSLEVGKNRLESLGDVEESADLFRYYAQIWEENNGYERPLGKLSPNEKTLSVLRPFGVFAVISPFNFPMALAAGMAGAALLAGNSVLLKPSQEAPWVAYKLMECLRDAGMPEGVFQLLYGTGSQLGEALLTHPKIDGIAFTGSKEVGLRIYREFAKDFIKPCLMELGGKNPAFICESADLEKAVEGAYRSAFGMGGQKCSALSRVYVHKKLLSTFTRELIARTEKTVIGDPTKSDVYLGPLINQKALTRHLEAIKHTKEAGKILYGGRNLQEQKAFEKGWFAEPTIAEAPRTSRIFREEFFSPFLAVTSFDDLEEAISHANQSEYGLTAGIFSENAKEIEYFFDHIENGVLYANRMTGATTGAWPGVQAFCGWKGSGSTGKGGCGPYYTSQFGREQSRTVMT